MVCPWLQGSIMPPNLLLTVQPVTADLPQSPQLRPRDGPGRAAGSAHGAAQSLTSASQARL